MNPSNQFNHNQGKGQELVNSSSRMWSKAARLLCFVAITLFLFLINLGQPTRSEAADAHASVYKLYEQSAIKINVVPNSKHHIYSADPTARAFGGRLYVYTSTDAQDCTVNEGTNRFCMPGYQVFSTSDMSNWTEHEYRVTRNGRTINTDLAFDYTQVTYSGWGEDQNTKTRTKRMWAPDVVKKGNKYYLFFPANFKIGVAVADKPEGPFTLLSERPIIGHGIDPSVIEVQGKWYIYWESGSEIVVQQLADDFRSLAPNTSPKTLPLIEAEGQSGNVNGDGGHKEGPFVHKTNGNLWITYAHNLPGDTYSQGKCFKAGYTIRQAKALDPNNPLGDYKSWPINNTKGLVMARFDKGNNHNSVVTFNNKSYIFYHENLVDPVAGKSYVGRRVVWSPASIRNSGSIRSIYRPINEEGFGCDGIPENEIGGRAPTPSNGGDDSLNRRLWQRIEVENSQTLHKAKASGNALSFIESGGHAIYRSVRTLHGKRVHINYSTSHDLGGELEIRVGSTTGQVLAKTTLENTGGWESYKTIQVPLTGTTPRGYQPLVLVFKSSGGNTHKYLYNINWVEFKK